MKTSKLRELIRETIKEGNFDDRFKHHMGKAGYSDKEMDDVMSRSDQSWGFKEPGEDERESPFMDDDDDRSPGEELASRTIEKLRQQYRGISDQDMDDFSKEMALHFINNDAAKAAVMVKFGKDAGPEKDI